LGKEGGLITGNSINFTLRGMTICKYLFSKKGIL